MRDAVRAALVTAIVLTGIVTVGAIAVGDAGWPGEPSGCIAAGDCYCEAFTHGVVEQPANTFSNFGFVAVGLWVLSQVGMRPIRQGGGHDDPGATTAGQGAPEPASFSTDPRLTRLYGWIAIGLGVGSMLFHGTMTEWGGWADLVSMYTFITFFLLYEVRINRRTTVDWLLRAWLIVNAGLAVLQWFADNGAGKFVFAALIVATLGANRRVVHGGPSSTLIRDERWFWVGLAIYVAGNVIWTLSRTGAVLCNPESLLQGHAVWHLTSAAAVAAFFVYLRSERPHVVESHTQSSSDHHL